MRILLYILVALGLLVAAGSIYVRTAALDAQALHVDPADVTPPASNNYALLAGTTGSYIEANLAEVGARIAAVAEADGAEVLAGSASDGHVTYVMRSRIMGFPDAISIRMTPEGAGTQVDLFSRSVYGVSDLGANTERAQRWLQAARGATVFGGGD